MSPRTDLALETAETFSQKLPKGVTLHTQQLNEVEIQTVEITGEEGAKAFGKPQGRYVTLSMPPLLESASCCDDQAEALRSQLAPLLPPKGLALVVGLGNIAITPDALGPRMASKILATRHLMGATQVPLLDELRPVAAVAPGVLGQTGIESWEMIHSLVKDLKPVAVIAVDALAAREVSRLGCTIQLSDTGISPGSGVMNRRKELSRHTLGIPVLSVGIPTVVDAWSLAQQLSGKEQPPKSGELNQMIVTPREIDQLIDRGAQVISMAINRALQPGLSAEDLSYLMS